MTSPKWGNNGLKKFLEKVYLIKRTLSLYLALQRKSWFNVSGPLFVCFYHILITNVCKQEHGLITFMAGATFKRLNVTRLLLF